ncbi:MAG TPA: hypothetical protein VG298_04980 [Acidimicrobiales bacterium]|jgi:hypothetical protein|nr:hypothetical protein [Acidimicrobiales bacterium]
MRLAQCDECKRQEELARFNDAPHSWFFVRQEFDREFEDRFWQFCSVSCVASFFALREMAPPTPNTD